MKKKVLYLNGLLILGLLLNSIQLKSSIPESKISHHLKLEYLISVVETDDKSFSIKAKISGIRTDKFLIRMTANYGRLEKVEELLPKLETTGQGEKISSIEKIDPFLWKISTEDISEIEIDYMINTQFPYSTLNMVRLPFRGQNYLYFPAASAFIHPDPEFLRSNRIIIEEIKLRFDLPENWTAATSWGTDAGIILIEPPEIDNLNSGLIGLGSYRTYSLKVKNLLLETAFLGEGPAADDEFNQVIIEALNSGYKIFKFFPLNRFFALFHFVFEQPGQGSGNFLGWSTCLNYSRRFNDPRWLEKKSHIFHEIFHFWNGTNGPPLSRAQDDYSLIWFTEGITRYYQYKNMYTSRTINENEFFAFMAKQFETTYNNSLCELNLDEISRQYYSDRQAFELSYSKGCCLGFALDLHLQTVSKNKKSFDSVLQLLLEKRDFLKTGLHLTKKDIDKTLLEILGEKYFSVYLNLYGQGFLEQFKEIIDRAGLSLERRKGRLIYFGVLNFGPPGDEVKVLSVDRESPAYKNGLRAGDIILEINGQKLKSPASIKELVKNIPKNELTELTLRRNGKNLQIMTSWNSYATEFVISRNRGLQNEL